MDLIRFLRRKGERDEKEQGFPEGDMILPQQDVDFPFFLPVMVNFSAATRGFRANLDFLLDFRSLFSFAGLRVNRLPLVLLL